ncbi:MAG TPA: TIGR02611 family protein [Actinoplanes sp.]|nr:TIGR02611 family protein [Actinoplanes sp.]
MFIGTLGAVVVLVGIALIPLPGPGWAIVVLGLAIWAIEFVWAKHLLRYTRKRLAKWTHWVARQSLAVRAVIGAVGLVFVNVVIWMSVRMTFHIDLFEICRDFVAGR